MSEPATTDKRVASCPSAVVPSNTTPFDVETVVTLFVVVVPVTVKLPGIVTVSDESPIDTALLPNELPNLVLRLATETSSFVSVLVSVELITPPLLIATLVPAVNLPLTSAVDNCVFVSVEVITPVELLYDALPLAEILPLTSAVDNCVLVSVEVITPVELLYDAFPLADILPLTSAVDNWVLVSVLVSIELILIVLAASSNTTVVFVPFIHCPAAKSLISSSERWVLVSVEVITPVELLYDAFPLADILLLTWASLSCVFVSVLVITPVDVLIPVPLNLPLTSAVDSWVFVSVEVITPVELL